MHLCLTNHMINSLRIHVAWCVIGGVILEPLDPWRWIQYILSKKSEWLTQHDVIYRVSQEECARLQESVPYVKVYRYNPKHLYPKLNGYGDNGQRKVRSSRGSTYCTFSADALRIHCTCPWDWNAVNIVPACPCKVLGTLRMTTALMGVFM